jgi:hypothetical protein
MHLGIRKSLTQSRGGTGNRSDPSLRLSAHEDLFRARRGIGKGAGEPKSLSRDPIRKYFCPANGSPFVEFRTLFTHEKSRSEKHDLSVV